jgi:hypothetical protein
MVRRCGVARRLGARQNEEVRGVLGGNREIRDCLEESLQRSQVSARAYPLLDVRRDPDVLALELEAAKVVANDLAVVKMDSPCPTRSRPIRTDGGLGQRVHLSSVHVAPRNAGRATGQRPREPSPVTTTLRSVPLLPGSNFCPGGTGSMPG